MKKKLLEILLSLAILWAATSTFLYVQLKNNPRVVAVTTGLNSPSSPENFQLGEMEKITFLRQYLERYFNYDSNNFWQTQASLSFLMAPELRDRRLEEVRRLREKIQQKNLIQKAQLISLSSKGPNSFEALITQQLIEGQNKTSDLNITIQMELSTTERTLENPWGLVVKHMEILAPTTDAAPFNSHLKIIAKNPLIITFPCAIQNIENSNEADVKTKITTFNVSEIQITTAKGLSAPVTMKALCKDSEFSFELSAVDKQQDLFKAFPLESGTARKKDLPTSTQPKVRKKDIYEEAVERALRSKGSN
ncbi:hypothetical protein [Bdellovibrio svalbardensis]|uniref:Uncharacterized protein n=1 Tax=Bdellovibrio svalbardensis TaxID=2972972 RepID=A0ABT6DLN2_9BACT|nr:hypothetical protein [Bdellovibrio svalbardensis]MDG0817792.1 hypothetical protein [Bdellovibrio svalbardensis]